MRFRKQQDDNEQPLKSRWQHDNDVELAAAKDAAKGALKGKWWITICAIVPCVCLLITFRLIAQFNNFTTEFATLYKTAVSEKPGRQAALQNVNKWMSGTDSPFQSGYSNLWWNNAELVDTVTAASTGDSTTTQYWSHSMSFTDKSDGSTRDVTQLIAIKDGICTPVGSPTILPMQPQSGDTSSGYSPNQNAPIDQPSTLANTVTTWAKAYVGKDRDTLTVLVADPNTDHAYQPAAVGTLKNASVNWLVACDEHGNIPSEKVEGTPKYGAAGVTIQFTPYSAASNDPNGGSGPVSSTSTMNITLLIENPTTGSARIVDWGADGAVRKLAKYSNALDKNQLMADSKTDETDSATNSSVTGDGGATADPGTVTDGNTANGGQ